jgi:hypothetical protein
MEAKLVGDNAANPALQGYAVAISFDGNTVAISGALDNSKTHDCGIGAVWIFTRVVETNTWTQQGEKLVGTGYVAPSCQGFSLAMSADGNTLASGAYADASYTGAVWVFTRDPTTQVWSQSGEKLVGAFPTSSKQTRQGNSVALSADGTILAVGGVSGGMKSAFWIFRLDQASSSWKAEGNAYLPSESGSEVYGAAVSLSADGSVVALGSEGDNYALGSFWIFQRDSATNTYKQATSKLVGTGNTGRACQGTSLSLRPDGQRLAIGGDLDDNYLGATWIFDYDSATGHWIQQGSKLIGAGYTRTTSLFYVYQGISVSLVTLPNGTDLLAVGGSSDNNGIGATWVFSSN